MKPEFTPEFVKEKITELDNKYYIEDIGLTGYEWFIKGALETIERLQSRVQEVEDNREHIERLLCNAEKRVKELEAEQRWISVEERLPEEPGFYYCHITSKAGEAYERMSFYYGKGNFDVLTDTVTHWRRLPQPPKDGE
jgi:FtsZ-binding cell division protein ZapB